MIPATSPCSSSGGGVWRSPGGRTLALGCFVALAALLGAGASPASAAEPCPNEALREAQGPAALALPDCRAYEQVSPVDKNGNTLSGNLGLLKASLSGDRITFLAEAGISGGVAMGAFPLYLATRGAAGWSTRGFLPPPPQTTSFLSENLIGWSEDLSKEVALTEAEESGQRTVSLRDTATGESQLLDESDHGIEVDDMSPDGSCLLFESATALTPEARSGKTNLYQFDSQTSQLSLIGLLPASEGGQAPPGGSFDGALRGDYEEAIYTQNTLSADCSRAVFTAGETGQLYLREAGESYPIPGGHFDAATPDLSRVLVDDGTTLGEYDAQSHETVAQLTPPGGVQGVLGISTDGSYVYFANGSSELYEWHLGEAPIAIAQVPDARNWARSHFEIVGGVNFAKTSRLSADGLTLLFLSGSRLTSYDNQGHAELYRYDAATQHLSCVSCNPSSEIAPTTDVTLQSISPSVLFPGEPSPQSLTRNLSASGDQVFFETPDPLLPADTNGAHGCPIVALSSGHGYVRSCQDVYEWEAAGAGSCAESSQTYSKESAGCLYLISTGTSSGPSYFADASASGEDAFFFTESQLVGQDRDGLTDVYDARVDGGLLGQDQSLPHICATGEECKPPSRGTPSQPGPSSSLPREPEKPPRTCKRGYVLRHGRCVKKKAHRHKRRAAGHRGGAAR